MSRRRGEESVVACKENMLEQYGFSFSCEFIRIFETGVQVEDAEGRVCDGRVKILAEPHGKRSERSLMLQ